MQYAEFVLDKLRQTQTVVACRAIWHFLSHHCSGSSRSRHHHPVSVRNPNHRGYRKRKKGYFDFEV